MTLITYITITILKQIRWSPLHWGPLGVIRLCGGSKDFQLHQCHVFNPKHMMAEILKLYRGSASLHLTFRNSQQLSPGFLRISNGKKRLKLVSFSSSLFRLCLEVRRGEAGRTLHSNWTFSFFLKCQHLNKRVKRGQYGEVVWVTPVCLLWLQKLIN